MSFSDKAKIIDHIPQNVNIKARQNVEPFSFNKPTTVWKVVAFVGALAIVVAALIQGSWK